MHARNEEPSKKSDKIADDAELASEETRAHLDSRTNHQNKRRGLFFLRVTTQQKKRNTRTVAVVLVRRCLAQRPWLYEIRPIRCRKDSQ